MSEKIHDPSLDKKKSWWGFLAKTTFVLAAIGLTGMTVLSVMGGNNDSLKETIESLVAQNTGYNAKINKFYGLEFFPTVRLDFEDLELTDPERGPAPVARVEKFSIALSFWDVLFRTGKLNRLDIQNAFAVPGVITKHAVHIKSVDIKRDDEEKAHVVARGVVGEKPLSVNVSMNVLGSAPYYKYQFSNPRKVDVEYGDVTLHGDMNDVHGYLKLENLSLKHLGHDVATADLALVNHGYKEIEVKGSVQLAEFGTTLEPDVIVDYGDPQMLIRGDFTVPNLAVRDFGDQTRLQKFIDLMDRDFGRPEQQIKEGEEAPAKPPLDLSFADLDLMVELAELKSHELTIGSLRGPVELRNGHLKIKKMKGKLSKGSVVFNLDLDASKLPLVLATDMQVEGMDYGELQKRLGGDVNVEGKADIVLNLTGQGESEDALLKSLNGEFTIMASEGQLKTGILNLWGGGLVNAMIPSLEPETDMTLNCGVVDFKIENGVANAQNLFFDTKRVTVVGKGDYKIADDSLDLKLKPEAKKIAIGDLSSGVIISGSIAAPDIHPSLVDLGTKVGGLLLGAVNPAVLVVTAAKVGGADKHPCSAFIDGYDEKVQAAKDAKSPKKSAENKPGSAEDMEQISPQAGGEMLND